ncbi:hypothetical protein A1F94_012638 [Pyrenophora tritici-repentis]|uniref:Uncharacterized protein n=3 Tax=Pyrenophora tritici-repentis TaxID=45151 RepID=A0A2W1DDL3_9PLEO|nr:hypothetical protein A1F99_127800 [Pyrenophora tritici-repentis]KAG9377038.1 hypothetical protein A1F94_012638 [Pyrenophora tritici-repentis]KAI0586998.1 hypothetical protein Alg215_01735 [Pyrenophora tritici-repentis]KAI0589029.1 hypothetical protein Alg130_03163 [Pyrenophora tritici-repentis]KAI0612603.1 hypothetical protein TUN205_03113 [Pyrenophora tritici-repentis]
MFPFSINTSTQQSIHRLYLHSTRVPIKPANSFKLQPQLLYIPLPINFRINNFIMPASVASSVSTIIKPAPITKCGESCECCGCDESCWCIVM